MGHDYELEEYGVITYEQLTNSPQYWMDKMIEARERANQADTSHINYVDAANNDIAQIHMDDVSLKNTSIVWVPCYHKKYITKICSDFDVKYGTDTKSKAVKTASTYGKHEMASEICIEDSGSHNEVTTTYNVHHRTESIILTTIELEDYTVTKTLGDGDCKVHRTLHDSPRATLGATSFSHTYVWQTVSFS